MTKLRTPGTLMAITAALILTACGSGSSSNNAPPDRPIGKVSGVANLGRIIDGKVTVYGFDGRKGAVLTTGRTDAQGDFNFSLQAATQSYFADLEGGYYSEESSGARIPLLSGQHLYSVGNYVSGQSINMSITYWTTLAAGLAEHKISVGTPVDKAITEANAAISDTLGLDIIATTPKDPTDPNNKSTTLTPALEYGFADAALSKWTALASTINKSPVHSTYTSIAFAQLAYDDIKYDGLLDGKGSAGTRKFGTIPLNQTVYRHDIATALLNMAADPLNVSGLTADKLLATALRLNDSTVAMYGTASVDPIDGTGPVFTSVEPKDNSPVHGVFTCTAVITDLVGLTSVEILIDGKLVGKATDLSAPSVNIDTTLPALAIADGSHLLGVRATNLTGTTTTNTSHIIVSNKGTTISNVSPVDAAYVRGSVKATVDVADPIGVKSVEYYLDGKPLGSVADVAAPEKVIDTTALGDGSHPLKIVVTNSVGYIVESNTTINVDNVLPVITATAPVENSVHADSFTASATAVDNNLTGVEFYVDGDPFGLAASKNNATKSIDTTTYKDGSHKLVVVASDSAGNAGTKTVPLIFDNTAPVITGVRPSSGSMFGPQSIDFGATVTDLALANVEFRIDNIPQGGATTAQSIAIAAASLSEGTHTLKLIATDTTGHTSEASTSVIADHTPPYQDLSAGYYTGSNYLFVGKSSDFVAGMNSVKVNGNYINVTKASGGMLADWTFMAIAPTISFTSNRCADSFTPANWLLTDVIIETDNVGNSRTTQVAWCYDWVNGATVSQWPK